MSAKLPELAKLGQKRRGSQQQQGLCLQAPVAALFGSALAGGLVKRAGGEFPRREARWVGGSFPNRSQAAAGRTREAAGSRLGAAGEASPALLRVLRLPGAADGESARDPAAAAAPAPAPQLGPFAGGARKFSGKMLQEW